MTGEDCPVCDRPLAQHLDPRVDARCAILAGADPADYPTALPSSCWAFGRYAWAGDWPPRPRRRRRTR